MCGVSGAVEENHMTIAIVDYGMANLRSVQKAFERVGFAAEITSDPQVIFRANKVPGVAVETVA